MVDPNKSKLPAEPEADARQRQAAIELAATTKLLSKIGWGVLALMIVAVVVFWLGWVRAPDPATICAHKVDLVFNTVGADQREGAEALVGQLEITCVEAAKRKIQMRGKLVYADYAKCVMAASALSQAERC